MLPAVRTVKASEIRKVVEFMKQFEQASAFVGVDIEHATKTYEHMVEQGVAVVMVLEKDGEMIGSLGFIKYPDIHSGEQMIVETFWFADPKKRGYGIKLLNAFENYAREHGINKIAMIHMMDSYPEQLERLYLKRGYRLIEKHYVRYLNGGVK